MARETDYCGIASGSEIDKVDTALEIKRLYPDMGIIIMTGYGQEHPLVRQTINEQLGKLLSKPFNFDELFQAISDHVSASRKSTPN
ncbi:MAG: hypothetical protein HN929_11130 [Chloroflexi bacterium]|jgi:DNA-binding NtrC family response regulator|nr:hypothetical protein [Chloroflexota bacterium]MBT7081993.1 hypothetical protein [Chloroflexota bacterium]MBT7289660.1 hypothetical protein [Chloroflexota bacterium]